MNKLDIINVLEGDDCEEKEYCLGTIQLRNGAIALGIANMFLYLTLFVICFSINYANPMVSVILVLTVVCELLAGISIIFGVRFDMPRLLIPQILFSAVMMIYTPLMIIVCTIMAFFPLTIGVSIIPHILSQQTVDKISAMDEDDQAYYTTLHAACLCAVGFIQCLISTLTVRTCVQCYAYIKALRKIVERIPEPIISIIYANSCE